MVSKLSIFFNTGSETIQKNTKVLKPRSFETEMSHFASGSNLTPRIPNSCSPACHKKRHMAISREPSVVSKIPWWETIFNKKTKTAKNGQKW